MRRLRLLWCAALLGHMVPAGAADDVTAPPAPRKFEIKGFATTWSWNQGLQYGIDVPDVPETWEAGDLRWRPLLRGNLGIRLGIDAVGVVQHGRFVEVDDDVGVRRGYLYADGSVAGFRKPLTYKFEVGAVNDRFSLRNASLAVHEIPYAGTFRVGAFDAPLSLAMLTSSRATPLMERGMPVDAFAPGTLSGLSLTNHLEAQRVTWSLGLFTEGSDADVGDESDAAARVVGRLTWLPWRRSEDLLHVGLSGSWAFSPGEEIQFSSRPESFFAPPIVDTGEIDAQQSVVVGLESAWVRDRLSLQGEYLRAIVLRDDSADAHFGGVYLMASYFLTPDSRTYDEEAAAFASVVPSHPISWAARRIGAVETALRLSFLDLTDGDVRGGRAVELMSGLNWYWNRYVRLQLNVGWYHASGGPRPGDAAVLQTRFDLLI